MTIEFFKYQGTGNDFVLIDNRNGQFPKDAEVISYICDRKFGVGSDGLILIEHHPELDYRMVFFNPDGSQSLCGNGSRCGFQFARDLDIVSNKATFETTDGIHKAELSDGTISISLFPVQLIKALDEDFYLNTGSPHFVRLVEDVEHTDVVTVGRKIRYSADYSGQNGTNVNFAQLLPDHIRVRTYERGVENETLSCGTGVTAVALVGALNGYSSPVTVETQGGRLAVTYEKNEEGFKNIWLSGSVQFVFKGDMQI